eukprot:CAMPEP_0203679224 /NCGR_PEP_ID=MMETSP0090-20130426/34891_1 /ASSEMBLY_ACC=CAM_ASM_001088 /TAXON_ID=426623 /ORGANISM="Chaetoceros affinis, Strain CCMP159" /LENGTH=77 /DNA_ID=CAMNT_0050546787 /DNA_START=12 /DNA_END=242 /DNA_ORIENTATION=-
MVNEVRNLDVFVMTDCGKLIFNRFDTNNANEEEDLCSMCGFIQAIRATTVNDESLNFGEIQYIKANTFKVVFMTVGC